VEGRVARSAESQLGMISPKSNPETESSGIHVAYVVAQANGRTIPVRIANTTNKEIELASGKNIAEFNIK